VEIDADVFTKDLAAPAIMISCNHDDGDAGITKVGERGKHAKGRARNDTLPLEPKLEEVAIDDERSRAPG
jgi:hypothetical protein